MQDTLVAACRDMAGEYECFSEAYQAQIRKALDAMKDLIDDEHERREIDIIFQGSLKRHGEEEISLWLKHSKEMAALKKQQKREMPALRRRQREEMAALENQQKEKMAALEKQRKEEMEALLRSHKEEIEIL